MNIIKKETIDFWDFYKKLIEMLDNDWVINTLIVRECYIYNIPKNYPFIQVTAGKKFLWIKKQGDVRLCGFLVKGGLIFENNNLSSGGREVIEIQIPQDLQKNA